MDLNGTSAIVTGGASGIGEASARLLAERGAACVILDLNEEAGMRVADEVSGAFVKADVTDEEQVRTAIEVACGLGSLRGLVNSAGYGSAIKTVNRHGEPYPQDKFEAVVRLNLFGTFNCTRLAAAEMARTDPVDDFGSRGAIVNIASAAAFDGQVGQVAYSAAKAGIAGMTLPLARDLAAVGVRVNTVAPGLINTPIYGTSEKSEEFKNALGQSVVFPQRLGTSRELASMVLECITNDYMNGETVRVDGAIRLPPKSWTPGKKKS